MARVFYRFPAGKRGSYRLLPNFTKDHIPDIRTLASIRIPGALVKLKTQIPDVYKSTFEEGGPKATVQTNNWNGQPDTCGRYCEFDGSGEGDG